MTTSLDALHARLVETATREGILDVAYRTVDSPVGSLLLATTDAGLVRVAFEVQDHDAALATLAASVSPRILRAPARLDRIARELDEYFARRRHAFDVPLDLRLAHGFRREVLDQLPLIAYGRTSSYTDVATAAGSPRAVRAVGTACALNPVPIVVPCHRVVPASGGVGNYGLGPSRKVELLRREGSLGQTERPRRTAGDQG
jgi:methylated-DNA-[protein]-cysteine S-methyltransferase